MYKISALQKLHLKYFTIHKNCLKNFKNGSWNLKASIKDRSFCFLVDEQ